MISGLVLLLIHLLPVFSKLLYILLWWVISAIIGNQGGASIHIRTLRITRAWLGRDWSYNNCGVYDGL